MVSSTLFETLTGYPEPGGAGGGVPELLAPGVPAAPSADREPPEAMFDRILEELQKASESDPAFAKKLSEAFGVPRDLPALRAHLERSRAVVAASRQSDLLGTGAVAWPAIEESFRGPELLAVPPDFSDDYVRRHVAERYWKDQPRIDLDPTLPRFEDDSVLGVLGWMVFNGPQAIRVPRSLTPPFREQFGKIHGAATFPRPAPADTIHPLGTPEPGGTTRIALFADFGTGLAHSRFIARQIAVDRYDAAVHLGDVYYTGIANQYTEYFESPLVPALRAGTRLFVIPDNHDGYSGFHAYLDFLGRRTCQRGSYFAIETEHVQLIGIDTIWHSERGRIQDDGVRTWLRERLAAGRDSRRANVLLTGHEPYTYGNAQCEDLLGDVLGLGERVDLWFWGNTHYCALFQRTDATPFVGSCIGHAGYPYARYPRSAEKDRATPVHFVETGSRYEGSTVRTDRGMNGFCALEIDPSGAVRLRYLDWRGRERCLAGFEKQPDGSLGLLEPVEDRTA